MSDSGKRITLICAGKLRKTVVLTSPPFAEIGDCVEWDGLTYHVVACEDVEIILKVASSGVPMPRENLLRPLDTSYTPWTEARRWRRRFWALVAFNVGLAVALLYCAR